MHTLKANTENCSSFFCELDYYPYGMAMPGRNGMNANYRFTFQGQEKDDEIKGENNSINYKYRMHDPRIGRFFAVDPLAPKYPHNSPYAFSENRVIDGVELEGLEYANATYTIDQNGTILSITGTPWNAATPNVHGPLGQGVSVSVFMKNDDGGSTLIHQTFIERNAALPFGGQVAVAIIDGVYGYYDSDYGLYMGATSLRIVDINGCTYDSNGKPYGFSYHLDAIDAVDNAAKKHDLAYDAIGAVGRNSLTNDWGAIEADRSAVAEWQQIVKLGVGGIDPYTGAPITLNEYQAAKNAVYYFHGFTEQEGGVIGDKVSAAANWWYDNYVNREGKFHDMYYTDTEHYYQKFRDMYMYQGSDGVWLRKEGMWSQDKDGNFTPIVVP